MHIRVVDDDGSVTIRDVSSFFTTHDKADKEIIFFYDHTVISNKKKGVSIDSAYIRMVAFKESDKAKADLFLKRLTYAIRNSVHFFDCEEELERIDYEFELKEKGIKEAEAFKKLAETEVQSCKE